MSVDGDRNLQVNKGNFSALDLREGGFRSAVITSPLSNLT